jgi:uncharacterized protein (UPF0335 family)
MNDNFYGEDSFSLHQQMSDYIQKLEAEKKELIEQNKNLLDEITNGCHRCTENCSLSPMSEEYTRLEAEKKELIEFIKNIEDTNIDELLDIKIPEILNKFKEET